LFDAQAVVTPFDKYSPSQGTDRNRTHAKE